MATKDHSGYTSLMSPTESILSRNAINSLVGAGKHFDSQDWTAGYKNGDSDRDECASTISSRDPSLGCDDQLVRSFKKYVLYNGIRFMIITLMIMIIAILRQYALYQHYDTNLCCYCYKQALVNPQDIFEWQTCHYDKNIVNPDTICDINTPWENPTNLSTTYHLFPVIWYYFVTASILCGISLIYVILTFCSTFYCFTSSVDILLRRLPLELMLSCNVFISILCFYQLYIDYQFFPDSDYTNDNGKRCYIDSLNKKDEDFMFGILIFAFVYIISPTILVFTLHFVKHYLSSTFYAICQKIYNWIFFGCCGIVVLLFIAIVMFYTFYIILPHFADNKGWSAWLIVIFIQSLSFMSFVDICNFQIFKYPRNPFIIIIKANGCYRICCRNKHNRRSTNFIKIMRPSSIHDDDNDNETFIQ